jgi:hypothetical protein
VEKLGKKLPNTVKNDKSSSLPSSTTRTVNRDDIEDDYDSDPIPMKSNSKPIPQLSLKDKKNSFNFDDDDFDDDLNKSNQSSPVKLTKIDSYRDNNPVIMESKNSIGLQESDFYDDVDDNELLNQNLKVKKVKSETVQPSNNRDKLDTKANKTINTITNTNKSSNDRGNDIITVKPMFDAKDGRTDKKPTVKKIPLSTVDEFEDLSDDAFLPSNKNTDVNKKNIILNKKSDMEKMTIKSKNVTAAPIISNNDTTTGKSNLTSILLHLATRVL